MHRRLMLLLFLGLLLTLGSSCAMFDPVSPPDLPVTVPETFSLYDGERPKNYRWWESFGQEGLNRLVTAALADNFDIRQAWARLDQARALAVQAGAARYPDLTASAGASLGRRGIADGTRNRTATVRDYSLGLVSQYEIDLWSRIRSGQNAAVTRVVASREDLSAAAMSIAAEIGLRWADLRAQGLEKALLYEQLELNETILELVELRFRNGMVSALDVFQQKQVIADTQGQIPLVAKQERLLSNQLALLSGRVPGSELNLESGELPEIAAPPAAGLPAEVLAARPDVRAAGLRLAAAEWQVAQARANRLPALRLTAQSSYGSESIDRLFDNWLLNLAANLSAPLLDGGFRKAEVELQQARVEERLNAYGQVVLTAMGEVEDALAGEVQQRRHMRWLQEETTAARRALEEATFRYRNGLNDYLPVLTQLLSVQRLEREQIRQEAVLLKTRIDLYRALGGDWADDLTPPLS